MTYFREQSKKFLWTFPKSPTFKKELESIRIAEQILVPPSYKVPPMTFAGGLDWASYNNAAPGFRWWLNGMKYLRPLLSEEFATENDVQYAVAMIKDWVDHNPYAAPASNYAWDGHATAIRAEHLAALYAIGYRADWLTESIDEHAAVLSCSSFHQGNWNHGLDQDIGLLALGCAKNIKEWIETARRRALANFEQSVDIEGVSNEQAVGYQYYVFLRFNELKIRLEKAGAEIPSSMDSRLELMLDFCTHATAPDGTWVQLGDTLLTSAKEDATDLDCFAEESELAYAVNNGRKGSKPLLCHKVFSAGFVFARTGWGCAEGINEENYYTLRFGPGRIVHGHNDHTSLTYHHRGRRILIDGGFHGYTNDAMRDHLRRPEAHNVVIKEGAAKFRWDATTTLTHREINNICHSYFMRDSPYDGVERHRAVLALIQDGIFVVYDRIKSRSNATFQQIWNFDRDFHFWSAGEGAVVLMDEVNKVTVQQLWPYEEIILYRGSDTPKRGWAGYERYELSEVPTTVFKKKGNYVNFLTVISVSKKSKQPLSIKQKPIKNGLVNRIVALSRDDTTVSVAVMENGTLELSI